MKRVILIGALILGAAVAAILIFAYFAGEQIIGPMLKCLGLDIAAVVIVIIVVKGIPSPTERFVGMLLGQNYAVEKTKRKQKPSRLRFSIQFPTRPKRIARRTRSGAKSKRELDELLPPETEDTKIKD
ncbi:MAG TPA: hypothetical protein VHP83_15705 [Aggregatilineaceae bacterium]|nr:hypothetical protein [Aggregatilineaceae bacterium]